MNQLSELLGPYAAAACERVTGQTVEAWTRIKAERLHEAVRTRKIELGRLYTADQTDNMTRWYGLPFDAFEVVTIRTADTLSTRLEQDTLNAWDERQRGKTPTIEVDRRGRSESMAILSQLRTVTRYRLVKLESTPEKTVNILPLQTGRRELPAGDRE